MASSLKLKNLDPGWEKSNKAWKKLSLEHQIGLLNDAINPIAKAATLSALSSDLALSMRTIISEIYKQIDNLDTELRQLKQG